jgi:predicted permease
MTLKGLHWDKVPHDNDEEVAARGILYLLIFQQLGQVVRWSWGFNSLLAKPEKFTIEEGGTGSSGPLEDGVYRDFSEANSIFDESPSTLTDGPPTPTGKKLGDSVIFPTNASHSDYESGTVTPNGGRTYVLSNATSSASLSPTESEDDFDPTTSASRPLLSTPANGNIKPGATAFRGPNGYITSFPSFGSPTAETRDPKGFKEKTKLWWRCQSTKMKGQAAKIGEKTSALGHKIFASFPQPIQKGLDKLGNWIQRFFVMLWAQMNPPLWAMLIAIIVASVPALQHLFFDRGTFVNNSITRAVQQNGGVAVPLILVVLGANLARNTLPKEARQTADDPKFERNLLIASMVSRMVLPLVFMTPLLALTAKFVPISILDDPIFLIVCFLLTGAPSALQLAQICQLNDVYMGTVSKLLFHSYVVW